MPGLRSEAVAAIKQPVPPRGFEPPACLTLAEAVRRVLDRLYDGSPLPSALQPKKRVLRDFGAGMISDYKT